MLLQVPVCWLLVTSTVLGFLHIQFPQQELLPVELLLCLDSVLQGPRAEVVSTKIKIRKRHNECGVLISLVLSSCSKDLKQQTDQCFQAQFIGKQRNYINEREGAPTQRLIETKPPAQRLAPLLMCFSPPLDLALYKLGPR